MSEKDTQKTVPPKTWKKGEPRPYTAKEAQSSAGNKGYQEELANIARKRILKKGPEYNSTTVSSARLHLGASNTQMGKKTTQKHTDSIAISNVKAKHEAKGDRSRRRSGTSRRPSDSTNQEATT
ncbi:hypothetical protein NDU88_005574 [Pleurodeles waltl]|uniref:Uncharacterized protein n=1 Tax=Pleurodeles waltl TaxID=8319 RepID=A0AAV7TB08_PLEWA|nr:hypothetical protein NDU88_005574 [Pleurodeles waltl]